MLQTAGLSELCVRVGASASIRIAPMERLMARFEVPDEWTAQAYRFALDPSPSQARALESHCGRWVRTQRRIAKVHARVAHIRAHEINIATTALATRHQVVVCERLNAAAMSRRGGTRKRGLNRALADAAPGRIRRQLVYKTVWYGSTLVVAPPAFPSTQSCSRCGAKTKLHLRDRIYRCRNGCPPIDRDLNAAINLARLSDTTTTGGRMRTGTGSGPDANHRVGDGRGANQKTSPTTTAAGTAGGDEASTPLTNKTGTATPQGEAA
jgi:putative transposase